MKIQELLLSYFTIALLVNPDKKRGRQLASQQIAKVCETAPKVFDLVKRKYQIFALMSRLHISKQAWDAILDSKFYNTLRKNHTFE